MADRSARRGLTNGSAAGPDRRGDRTDGLVNGLGRTNGLVNGLGRTNGLVNGLGRTNGLVNGTRAGLVNGVRGRTNGSVPRGGERGGFVNGSGYVNGLSLRGNPFGIVTHRDLPRGIAILALTLPVVIIVGYLASVSPSQAPAYGVDGDFREWIPAMYTDPNDLQIASVDLVAYGVHDSQGTIYVWAETRGPLFAEPDASSLYVFVNTGGSGYAALPGFDANLVAELYGWNGTLQGASLRQWAGGDRDNASAFERLGSFPAIAVGNQVELSLDEDALGVDPSNATLVVATRMGARVDVGVIVGAVPGALEVTQEPIATTVSGSTSVLRITLHARGADVIVRRLSFAQMGGGSVQGPPTPISIAGDSDSAMTVALDPAGLPPGTLMTVALAGVEATTGGANPRPVPVTLRGDGARVYVDAVPSGKVVDGVFEDWTNVTLDPADPMLPPSVDIIESATAVETGAFFYVRVQGDAMAGAALPEARIPTRAGGGPGNGGAVVPIGRVAGEDLLRVYLDTDDRDATGQRFGGLIADRLLEVRGRLGSITARSTLAWDATAGGWRPVPGSTFDTAFVGSRFEAFVSPGFLGTMNNPRILFAATDWSGRGDVTIPAGLRGGTRGDPGLGPLDGSNALTAYAYPLAGTPMVDGSCGSETNEYEGAFEFSDGTIHFFVGRVSATHRLYVCVESDTDDDSTADWGELLFDRSHDGMGAPQPDDRRFRVTSGGAGGTFTQEMGDGSTWVPCGGSCDSGNAAFGEFNNSATEAYEFDISFADVWSTNDPTPNQVAGFGIMVFDDSGPNTYWWGADNLDENAPDTWGHLEIAEFPGYATLLAMSAILGVLVGRRRLRPKDRAR